MLLFRYPHSPLARLFVKPCLWPTMFYFHSYFYLLPSLAYTKCFAAAYFAMPLMLLLVSSLNPHVVVRLVLGNANDRGHRSTGQALNRPYQPIASSFLSNQDAHGGGGQCLHVLQVFVGSINCTEWLKCLYVQVSKPSNPFFALVTGIYVKAPQATQTARMSWVERCPIPRRWGAVFVTKEPTTLPHNGAGVPGLSAVSCPPACFATVATAYIGLLRRRQFQADYEWRQSMAKEAFATQKLARQETRPAPR